MVFTKFSPIAKINFAKFCFIYLICKNSKFWRKKIVKCNQKFSLFSRNVSFAGHPSYNKHTDPTKLYNARLICLPETRLKEAFNICNEGITSGHRGVASMLDKFQRTFFVLSARDRIRRIVERCDICLTKEEKYQT